MRYDSCPNHVARGLVLTSSQFFGKLTDLFTSKKDSDHGTIYLVQKRRSYTDSTQATSLSRC